MSDESKPKGPGTLALHAGQTPDPTTHARAVPIYATTSYVFDDAAHAARLFALEEFGNIYSRLMNPTVDVLEKRLAAMDGGAAAVAWASGQAAITASILTICHSGQNFVSSTNLYGGTWTLFTQTFKNLGVEVRFFDPGRPEEIDRLVDANTRLVYFESTWLSPEQLRMIASIVWHADRTLRKHLGPTRWSRVQVVFLVDNDEYLLMVDRIAKDEKTRRLARRLSSTYVGDHRVSHDNQSFQEAASLAIGDTVGRRGPRALWSFMGMKEGLHTYLSAFMTLFYAEFVSVEVTTPDVRNRNSVELLFRTAREFFEANKMPVLRQVLCSELNTITFDRLAVSFAFWDYLFRSERHRLSQFIDRLSYHERRKWKPTGLWNAFRESVEKAFGYPAETLEAKVRALAAKDYALDDKRIQRLLQVEKACGETVMRTYRKSEERLAAGKSLSVGETMARRRVMEATDELLARSEVTF